MNKLPLILAGLLLPSCLLADFEKAPLAPRSTPAGETLFSKLTPGEIGLAGKNAYADPEMWGEKYGEFQGGAVGTGLAAGDIDGDGLVDLFAVTKTGPNRLYRQVAPLQFVDIAAQSGVMGGESWGTGCSFADIDNDGDLDLYVCQFDAPNLLYINDGNGKFTEAAAAAGIAVQSGSVIGAFEDYDRDGDLDLFLLTNVLDATGNPEGEPDLLFQNQGDGTFKEATGAAGIADDRGKGHSATWWDANGDQWPDLYVSNDFEAPDHLYKNNGDGTFTDITDLALPHTAWYSMGSDFGDINNDGRLDLLTADMANTTHFKSKVTMGDMGGWVDYFDAQVTPQYMKNAVFLNSGTHRFMEVAKMTGLSSTDWTWSTRFEDFDNDGWLDLHVTNGMVRSFTDSDMVNKIKSLQSKRQVIALVKNSPVLREKNLAFRNDGADTLHFSKVTSEWGLEHEGVSFGSVSADFDNDGDLDLVYANYEDELSFYRNDSQSNSLVIELDGTRSNSHGIGAQVVLETSQGTQIRKLTVARGVLSSSQAIAHFGLGGDTTAKSLTVYWPSGSVQTFNDIPAQQRIRIQEPDTGPSPSPAKESITTVKGLFAESANTLGLDFEHKEETFDDMVRQPLLPHRMNTLGGGIAIGDADSDGDSDIYFSGAAGQAGALYLNNGKGHYSKDASAQPWDKKIQTEEMAPLWVDLNRDGLLDLYVSSGSVETEAGDSSLSDSLYLNVGNGRFAEADASEFNPVSSSNSVVAAADFDADGDIDLFVGGRVVPGEYPRAPRSALLRNDGGVLVDVTDEVAPGLAESGMVTAALWTNAQGLSSRDLLVLAELEAPRYFENRSGKLTESTHDKGLGNLKGWWNSLTAADVDNDGDIDYVAGNLGFNTKYKANSAHPFRIYFNDFEGTGKCNVVEAKYEGDNLLPVRGRSCSSRAMPSIAEKFPTFHDFGAASLESVYAPEKLQESLVKEATELGSGIFINNGPQKAFSFKHLPRVAQIAPIYGIAAADFNGDGNIDLALAQNFNGPQVETGRYDGGIGLLLIGDGTGSFRGAEADESGIFIEDEARGMAVADLNSDGWPDLLTSRPNNAIQAYLNTGETSHKSMAISLRSATPGNPQALGAEILVVYSDASKRAFELSGNSGYLSQNEACIYLGVTDSLKPERIEITWPDGSQSQSNIDSNKNFQLIEQNDQLAAR
ncbi:FG-GAP-like repeat-containing protein [Pelagicoccus sp. SDUM812002]|uniref:FG-GAP-like repeat-containing protein n=1 Tax=Pelagicoccus sp. SDUM812002 TaxID=3041266 RepID=UPI00280D4AF5|nr:FG-GAP-like repeat-containing protein [Pelagicoccus sp. SDUM812002]MDQ8187824.1 FG-GAP-like repeat-containing protein [Pelagicoccus sp. SDUM812002]